MAVSVSAISAVTRRHFIPKLVDNITTSNPLLKKLDGSKETVDGGDDIRQPVFYAFNSAGNWYQGSEQQDTSENEKKTALVFDWKQRYENITINGLDTIKNAGAAKVIDHVKSEVMIAELSLKDAFGSGLYSDGTNAKAITGLRVAIATANTYGGIDQSSESWLQGQVDSTTTALSVGKMQERFEAATEDNDSPNMVPTTGTLYNSYYGKLQPLQRFSDGDMARGGFKNLLFNGVPVFVDSHCPASHMFFLNMKYLVIKSSKMRNFPGKFIDFQDFKAQDARIAKIYWAGEFICSSPRKQALMSALTS